jgi:hypothetical protein
MKPNRQLGNAIFASAALLTLGLLASCSEQRVAPPPQPAPTRTVSPVPPPALPTAPPRPGPQANWRDAPITPGNWQWNMANGQSAARFANGALELRCDRAAATVTILRSGTAQGPVPVTILTSTATRALTGTPAAGPRAAIAVSLAARDGLLDAMAFSRGRFAVEVAGLPTLYVPSWAEVSRVIEDCR